jgi:hypothetical protein
MTTPSQGHTASNSARRWPAFNCGFARSPSVRLAQVYGVSRGRTAMGLYRQSCQRVALGNEVLRSFGMLALVTEQMAQIDASLASDHVPPLMDAVHECELADCHEEMTDAMLRRALEQGTLTVEQARAAIKASALKRHRAEIKERALAQWISEQESEK